MRVLPTRLVLLRSTILTTGTVLASLALLASAGSANAQTAPTGLPSGGVFVEGSGQINQPSPSGLNITQSSQRSIIDWGTFSIGEGNQVHVDNAAGATLNRVIGGQLSQIHGQLSATGSVYLMNPQGVIVGPSGKVMTGGSFVASTRAIDAAAFMNGGPAAVSGTSAGAIVNQGSIVSQSGSVVMIARNVSNSGTISAKQGRISMVAADDVLLTTTDGKADNIFVSVRSATGGDVTQTGRIEAAAVALKAAGGNVFALAGNRDGLVQATGTTTVNGELWLSAPEGKVEVSGQLAATNHDGSGGSVLVQGREVAVAATAHISAAGTSGGEVLVGASAFGTGTGLAHKTTIESGATILAGGPAGGGRIETSGLIMDIGAATIDAGRGGQWLLDPDDLTIDTALATTITTSLNGGTDVTQATTAGGTGGVGDITVAAPIIWTGTGDLTLNAYRDLVVNQAISGGGGLALNAGGNVGINAAVFAAGLVSVENPGTTTIGAAGSISSGDIVAIDTGVFNNQGGAGAVSSTGANWYVLSTDPANDSDGGLAPDYYQYDFASVGAFPPGNGRFYRIAPSVNISLGNVTKSYDGTTTAFLDASNTTVTGVINSDVWTLSGTYESKDAGTGLTVTADNFQATHNGIPVFGYVTNAPVSADTGTITPAILTASIIGNPTKTYNRTTSVSLTQANLQLAGLAPGETITANGAASAGYDSPNAGSRTVDVTFTTPNFVAGSGTLLSNYILPTSASGPGLINPASLLVNGVTANDKVYDSTTAATLNTVGATIFGVIPGDTVTFDASGATGEFATKNVGNIIPVTATGFVLGGASAANYVVSQPTGLAANITRATIEVSGLFANDKIYDGSNFGAVNTDGMIITGIFPGDSVTPVASASAAIEFAQKDAGLDIPVNITGVTIGGPDGDNYILTFSDSLNADILRRQLTLSYTGFPTKVYDGTANFVATGANASLDNVVAGESVTISQASNIQFASKNVGVWDVTGTISTSDYQAGPNTQLSNYILPTSVTVTGEITPAPLEITIINNPTKGYDGNANASLGPNNFQVTGFVIGEGATVNQTSGQYASSNAGVWTVTANLDASDFDPNPVTSMSNYFIPSSVYGPGTITRIPIGPPGVINVDVTGNVSRPYDGTTIATLTPADYTLTGFIPGEGASITETVGQYDLKDAGPRTVLVLLDPSDFLANPGTNLSNYSLPSQATGIGTISPLTLIATITGDPTKVYNATNRAAVRPASYNIAGVLAGESVTVSPIVVALYDSPNVGSRTVTALFTADSQFVFGSNTLRTNYVLPTIAQGPGAITPAPLNVLGLNAQNKVYDQTTLATLTGTAQLYGVIGGDTVVLDGGSAVGNFATANVGTSIPVTVAGYSISGSSAANYQLFQPTGLSANITPRTLGVANVSARDKLYDGTTVATLEVGVGGASLTGVLAGDDVALNGAGSSASFLQKNVGTDLRVITSGFTLAGAQAGNYVLFQPTGLTADINPVPLTGSIIGNPTKTYDGTTSVQLTAANYSLTGFIAGEGGVITQSAGAAYDSPNAGARTITATEVVSDIVANPGTLLSNYILPSTISGPGTINQAQLIASIINNPTRVYNGTTVATLTPGNYLVQGFVAGESVTVTQTVGEYSSKNVGRRNVTATLGAGDFTGGSGTNMANYILPTTATGLGTITQATVQVIGVLANDKIYDGTTVATLDNSGASLSGVFGSDVVNVVPVSNGTFATKNVGTNIDVTATGYGISGADAFNYIVVQPTGLSADITQATIAITSVTKVYDATTAIPTVNTAYTLTPVYGSDSVQVNAGGLTGSYDNKNVGTGKGVTLSGVTLTGADALNYVISPTTTNAPIGIITPATLNVVGAVALDKTYDQNTVAQLDNTNTRLQTVLGSDVVDLNMATTGNFNNANAGIGKPVTTTGYSISGADALNYTLVQPQGLTATINPLQIFLASVTKIYDGTVNLPTASTGYSFTGVLAGDTVDANTSGVTGQYNDNQNVGTGKPVTVNGLTLTGASGGNYSISSSITGNIGIINQATLTAAIIGNPTKTYDGTNLATLTPADYQLTGFAAGEGADVTQSLGVYDSLNAGSRTVFVGLVSGNFTPTGTTLLSNYILPTSAEGPGTINPRLLTITGAFANNKVYDGTTAATLNSTGATLNNVVSGDTVALNSSVAYGTFASPNVNTGIPVTAAGYTLDNNPFGNYTLEQPQGLTADITQALLTLTRVTKVYDGGLTLPTASAAYTLGGVFGSDNVFVDTTGISGSYATKDVATGINITAAGIALGGTASGNYLIAPTLTNAPIGQITPAMLTAAIIGNPTKVYNGNNIATLGPANYQLTGFVANEGADVNQTLGVYDTPNAGPRTVTAGLTSGNFTATGTTLLSNYILPTTASGAGTITQAQLSAAIINNPTKVYNGNTVATLAPTNYALTGFISGEGADVTQTVGAYDSADAGPRTVTATLAAGDFTATGNTMLSNYVLPTSATGTGTITQAQLTAAITGNPTKVYDGTIAATLAPTDYQITGFVAGEGADINQAAGTYDSPNAGSRTVTTSLTAGNFTATGTTLLSNYILPTTATGAGTISQALLTVTIIGNPTRAYNGTDAATLTPANYQLTGFIGGQGATVNQTVGTYDGPNAGSHTVTASLASGDFTANGATLLSNYALPTIASGTGTITQALLTASIINNPTKTYDGTTAATLTPLNYQITGFAGGEGATVSQTVGTYDNPNAGSRNVTALLASGNFTANGGTLLSNYILPTSASGLGTISQAVLGIFVSGLPTKPYDGTNIATLTPGNYTLTGFVSGEGATVTETMGLYASPNAGTHLINVQLDSGDYVANSGTQLSNYVLPLQAIGGGLITRLQLNAAIIGNPTKTYDATTAATLTSANYQLTGFIAGQSGTITETAGTYDSANAGPRTVTASFGSADYVAGPNTLLSNYVLPLTATGDGTINPAALMAVIVGNPTKAYDGTTLATLGPANFQITGFMANEGADVNQTVGTYGGANAGSWNVTASLAPGNFTGTNGTLLGNYVLPTSASGMGTIDRATLLAVLTGVTKVYDGNTGALLTPSNYTLTGLASTDSITITETVGTYGSPNAGTHTVTALLDGTDFSAGGGTLLSNYILPTTASGLGVITRAQLIAAIIGNPTKTYDGTTAATLNPANYQITGFIAGEGADITQTVGTYDSADAGARTVTANLAFGDFTATGSTLLSNYDLPTTASGPGTINPRPISGRIGAGIINNPTKVYDGTDVATLDPSNYELDGFVGTDGATVTQTVGTYGNKNVGVSIVTANLSASDFVANSGTNLNNYVLPGVARGIGTITPAQLTAIVVGNPTKTYDGTDIAQLSPGNYQLIGFVPGEGASVSQPGGTYDSANAGARTVSAMLAAGAFTANNGTLLSNYILPTTASGPGQINPAALMAIIVGNPTRTYNGTTAATLGPANFQLTGFIGSDGATINQTVGAYDSANAGSRIVTAGLAAGNYAGTGSTLLSNYILPTSASGAGTINPATLLASITGNPTKIFDGNTDATLSTGMYTLTGFAPGEGASITETYGVYSLSSPGRHDVTAQLEQGDFTANPGTLFSNYILPTSASGPGTVQPIPEIPDALARTISNMHFYVPFPAIDPIYLGRTNAFAGLPSIVVPWRVTEVDDQFNFQSGAPTVNSTEQVLLQGYRNTQGFLRIELPKTVTYEVRP